jgi:hypothetical protein
MQTVTAVRRKEDDHHAERHDGYPGPCHHPEAAALGMGHCRADSPQDENEPVAQRTPVIRDESTRRSISCHAAEWRGELDLPDPNPPDRLPVLAVLIAIAVGLVVWHATRVNQARLGIRSRRGQIRTMSREIRTFVLRGIVVLTVFVLLVIAALKH